MLSPLISGVETLTGAFAAGGTAEPVTSSLTVSDSNSTTLTGATVSLGSTFQSGEDVLSFTNTPNITGSFNSTNGTLTLSGTDTVADYQAALRSIMYQDTSANPTSNIRQFTMNVSNGTDTSQSAFRYIIPSSPISNVETTTATYATGSGATNVTNTLNLANTPSGNINGATVQITANYANGQDVLGFTNTPNITGTFDPTTGMLTLAGTDTVANFQSALQSVTFDNTSSTPTAGVRRISITADGATNSVFAANRYISVGARSSTGSGATISNVETTAGTFAASGAAAPVTSAATVSDSSSSTLTGATVSLGPTFQSGEDVLAFANTPNITGNFDATTGTLTLSGMDTVANYQAALRAITYQDTSANPTPNIRRFTMNVSNGADTSQNTYRYVNPTSLISNVETTTNNYATGSGTTPVTSSLTLGNTASGNVNGATVQIGANYANGQDVLGFTNTPNITGHFDPTTGALTLTGNDTVANYQSALQSVTYANTSSTPTAGVRRISITADGATNPSFAANRYISVGTGTSSSSGASISNVETTAGTFTAGGAAAPVTSAATVSDSSSSTLTGATVSLGPTYRSGEDVLAFANTPNITGIFDATTGTLTLSGVDTVANYQAALRAITYQDTSANPTPNIRRFTMNVSNGTDTSQSTYRYINSTGLISNVETTTNNYATGSGATPVTNTLTLGNTASGNVNGATMKIDANYVNGEDVVAFTNTPNITGNFDPTTGTLTLTGTDTAANYQAALQSITYDNTSATPTTGIRRFAVTANGATDPSFITVRYFNVT